MSTRYTETKNGNAVLNGKLTLHGVTKEVLVNISQVGAGKDPWGGYRRGFEGTSQIVLADFGINKDLGPAATQLELFISLEGIRQ